MKKIFASLLMILSVVSLSAKTIYLNHGGNDLWGKDNATFFIHSWGSEDSDSQLTLVSGNVYSATIPDDNSKAVFIRMPENSTSINWDSNWGKTADLDIPSGSDLFTIKGWSYGDWSKYVAPDPEVKFYITGDWLDWNTMAIKSTEDTYTLNLEAGTYALKITLDGTWGTAKGFDQLTETVVGLYKAEEKEGDNNIGFELKTAGEVKVTYTSSVFKLEGNFYYCEESYGLMINGVYKAGTKNELQHEWKEYMLRNVKLKQNDSIQLHDKCANASWVMTKFADTSYEFEIKNNKYVVSEDGTYDFYLKFIFGNDEVYISKHGVYSSAVPSQCEDVMMQAFFNESYSNSAPGVSEVGNTRWETLLPQAEEISSYFDLVWLPPSAYGEGMGYHPYDYSNQNSSWGSRAQLEALIAAFHGPDEDNPKTKVVADIVINHCQSKSGWCTFYDFDFGEFGHFYPTCDWICANDEVNSSDKSDCKGCAKGSDDDGQNWDGARDWAHDMPVVQNMFKAYLQWMRKVMKYDGFRYDKGDGFNNWHHDNYNKAAGPYIAFMECYTGNDEIINRINQADKNLMALDFQTRWSAIWENGNGGKPNTGIGAFNYRACQGSGLLGAGYAKNAVTFIDSHDWFLRSDAWGQEFGGYQQSLTDGEFGMKDRLLQANAYILSMPGLPCVFYPHWAKYKEQIKPMIEARKLAGVHTESPVYDEEAEDGGYKCTIGGKYGWLRLQLGNKTSNESCGDSNYKLIASGPGYAMWVYRTVPIPTSVENTEIPTIKAEKFMKDGKMYIRLGDKVYDVLGQTIK